MESSYHRVLRELKQHSGDAGYVTFFVPSEVTTLEDVATLLQVAKSYQKKIYQEVLDQMVLSAPPELEKTLVESYQELQGRLPPRKDFLNLAKDDYYKVGHALEAIKVEEAPWIKAAPGKPPRGARPPKVFGYGNARSRILSGLPDVLPLSRAKKGSLEIEFMNGWPFISLCAAILGVTILKDIEHAYSNSSMSRRLRSLLEGRAPSRDAAEAITRQTVTKIQRSRRVVSVQEHQGSFQIEVETLNMELIRTETETLEISRPEKKKR